MPRNPVVSGFIPLLVALLSFAPDFAGAASSSSPPRAEATIRALLVARDMSVHPVPLHPLVLVGESGDTIAVRTSVQGDAHVSLPPGRYAVRSTASASFEGVRYRWRLSVTLAVGAGTAIALTNDNAETEDTNAPAPGAGDRRLDPAAALYERLERSVFRIEAGLAHGTGFLVDSLGGVILTNAHVVEHADSAALCAVLSRHLRVVARVLARDADADIAVLGVHAGFLDGLQRIPLQRPGDSPPVTPGERLIAMGFPLHQELTITSGIASSVRAGAILSDVNINPGNSGGPLLDVEGVAVGVNTFGDVADQGAGVSGSILIARAGPALARAAERLREGIAFDPDTLPSMPTDRLDIGSLKAYVDTTDLARYAVFRGLTVGGFTVSVQSPVLSMVAIKQFENEIAKDRKKREAKAGLSESERYSEVREYRDWVEYVGPQTTPVVAFGVVPDVGETGGSAFARIMISPQLRATYRFRGDVKGVRVYRDGEPVEPIRGGHEPTRMFVENQWVSLKDVADQGYYIFDPELFRPDSNGVAPSIAIAVQDLKSPKKLKCRHLPPEVVVQTWNDFEAYYRDSHPTRGFIRADLKASTSHRKERSSPELDEACTWYAFRTYGLE